MVYSPTSYQGNPKPSFLGGYDPYIEGLKPSFFMVLGSKRYKVIHSLHPRNLTSIPKMATISKESPFPNHLGYPAIIFLGDVPTLGPQITCAHQNDSLAPKINCVGLINQPFRLGTGGDWGFRGGDWGLLHEQQPFRLKTGGGDLGFRGGDWGRNLYMEMFYNQQTTSLHLGWEPEGLGLYMETYPNGTLYWAELHATIHRCLYRYLQHYAGTSEQDTRAQAMP